MTTISDGSARKPGRPRSAQAHQAILQATLHLLAEDGYSGLTLEGVAARAGVGKTTIYRRWNSKEELVMDAIRSIHLEVPIIDTGNFRQDILTMLRNTMALNSPVIQGLLLKTLSEIESNPAIVQVFQERLVAPRFARLLQMIERAKARGEIRAELDTALILSLLGGPYFFLVLFNQFRSAFPAPTDFPEQLVDAILHGIAPAPQK